MLFSVLHVSEGIFADFSQQGTVNWVNYYSVKGKLDLGGKTYSKLTPQQQTLDVK